MTRDRRTPDQLDFDRAKHGWAFCNQAMLKGKIEQMEEIAQRLKQLDPRQATLNFIKEQYAKKEAKR